MTRAYILWVRGRREVAGWKRGGGEGYAITCVRRLGQVGMGSGRKVKGVCVLVYVCVCACVGGLFF